MEITQRSLEDEASMTVASGQRGKINTLSNDSAAASKMLTAQTQEEVLLNWGNLGKYLWFLVN